MAADGYRSDLDLVAVDQHGVLAAFVLVWHDAALNAGLFEPVGTHPAHRRRGVSRALLAEALARLHALRVSGVTVVAVGDDPITPRLYASVGFGLVGRNVAHRSG
jgi:predicted N-acetyltransferase YhbS